MIAGVFVSAPLGRGGGLGVVGDEGEEMIGEGVGAIMDISIAPGTLMVDEARRSTASPAERLFLGNESPVGGANDRQSDVLLVYDASEHSERFTFPQSMEMPEHWKTCVRKRGISRACVMWNMEGMACW
jgi:hypothetical protein